MKHYADRDHMALGNYYIRHVSAMTAEGLHAKSDIAAELAWRDFEIDRLKRCLSPAFVGILNEAAGIIRALPEEIGERLQVRHWLPDELEGSALMIKDATS